MAADRARTPVARLQSVTLRYGPRVVLDGADLEIRHGDRWVLLGPNGSGKTSLVRILSMYQHPSQGSVEVCGQRLGETDVRALRSRIGVMSAAVREMLRPALSAADAVMTAKHAALEPWWHHYDEGDRRRAHDLLESFGAGEFAGRALSTLSSGEQQRVLLARMLMADPDLLILDEPAAGLDMAAREELISTIDELGRRDGVPAILLVTHHVDEIPPSFDKAALLTGDGRLRAGPIGDVLTEKGLREAFEAPRLRIERREQRWFSWTDRDS